MMRSVSTARSWFHSTDSRTDCLMLNESGVIELKTKYGQDRVIVIRKQSAESHDSRIGRGLALWVNGSSHRGAAVSRDTRVSYDDRDDEQTSLPVGGQRLRRGTL